MSSTALSEQVSEDVRERFIEYHDDKESVESEDEDGPSLSGLADALK